MERWIASVEAKILIDFKLALRASRKLELDDLFEVCGEQTSYSLADAKRLHKQQWTGDQYMAAVDTSVDGKPRISQRGMLQTLQLRSQYIAERGATLNNPHVPKAHLDQFIGTDRDVSGPNWAVAVRRIANGFLTMNPKHPAVIAVPD